MQKPRLTTVRSRVADTLYALAGRVDAPSGSGLTHTVIVNGSGFSPGATVSDTSDVIDSLGRVESLSTWSAKADRHGAFTVRVTMPGPGLTLRPRTTFAGDVVIQRDDMPFDPLPSAYQAAFAGERVHLENSDETIVNVHSPHQCAGGSCPIHNRSNHLMRDFPQHWRSDRGIIERICPHGIGHPDPDDPATARDGIHGCDGCCAQH